MPALPSYVKILRGGFSEEPESALLRTDMETGPPKQALVKSRIMVSRPVELRIETLANYLAFKVWFRDTIHRGADWFDMIDPLDGTTRSTRFQGGKYTAAPASGKRLWTIKTTFETWDA